MKAGWVSRLNIDDWHYVTPMSALERFLSLIDDEYESGEFVRLTFPASDCSPPDCIHTSPTFVFDLVDKELKLRKPMATLGKAIT